MRRVFLELLQIKAGGIQTVILTVKAKANIIQRRINLDVSQFQLAAVRCFTCNLTNSISQVDGIKQGCLTASDQVSNQGFITVLDRFLIHQAIVFLPVLSQDSAGDQGVGVT